MNNLYSVTNPLYLPFRYQVRPTSQRSAAVPRAPSLMRCRRPSVASQVYRLRPHLLNCERTHGDARHSPTSASLPAARAEGDAQQH